jgi:hypothetical protein
MAAPSVTYTLTNGTTADATQVMQNFNDLINGVSDGTKDLSINALTCAGTATLNGNVNLGNASGDDLTVNASLASNLVPKTTNTYNLGSADLGYASLYLGTADSDTARIVAAAQAADRTYTVPDAGAAATFVMTEGAQTISGVKTFSSTSLVHTSTGATVLAVKSSSATGTTAIDFHPASEATRTAFIASAAQANDFITGSASGDLCLFGDNQAILFSAATGGAQHAKIDTTGLLTLATGVKFGSGTTLDAFTEDGGTTSGWTLDAGSYTNCGSAALAQWSTQRIGDRVHLSAQIDITVTGTTFSFSINKPIASSASDGSGASFFGRNSPNYAWGSVTSGSTTTLQFLGVASTSSSNTYRIAFTLIYRAD